MSDLPGWALRIASTMEARGFVDSDVSTLTGLPASTIARYRKGENSIPAERLGAVARALNVTTDFLVFGETIEPIMRICDKSSSETKGVVLIPLLDVIAAAGPGFENPHPYEIDRLPFPRAWLDRLGVPEKHARFLQARGDSMEPTIMEGAIILADTRHQTVKIDGIYVVIDGATVRIKRVAVGWNGALELISDNERYATEKLAAPDSEALRVAGKVVWAGGEI